MENVSTFFLENNTVPLDNNQQGVNILWTFFLCIVSLLSCFGNFLVCFTLYRRKYLLTSSNKLVFSLTVSNFGYSVLVFPFSVASSIAGKWMFGKVWCSLTAFLTMSLLGSSLITLSVISFDRYYAIVHPLKYPNRITSCRMTAVILACWSVALCLAVPPLFGAGAQYQYFVARFGCFPLWNRTIGFSLFWILICAILPMCFMISMYCSIFGVAREKYRNSSYRRKNMKIGRHRSWSSGSYCSKNSFVLSDTERGNASAKFDNSPVNKGFHELQAASNNSFVEDSGIASSGLIGCSQNIQSMAESSPHEPVYDQPYRHKVHNPEASCLSVDGPRQQTFKNDQIICKQMYSVQSSRTDVRHKQRGIQSHVLKRASSTSSNTCQRNVFHKRQVGFSNFQYYKNQKKACCTITVIVGSVLFTMSPFVVVSIVETFQGAAATLNSVGNVPSYKNVAIPDWLVSLTTILMYLTCVYYPVIYGLWNETLRNEIISILRRKSRAPNTRRTRILSLSTHIKDLGLSPRLTAAIMGESVAMAAVVYPMQVDTKASKQMRTTSARRSATPRVETSRKTTSQRPKVSPKVKTCFEEQPSCSKTIAPAKNDYKMRLEHQGNHVNVNTGNNVHIQGSSAVRVSTDAGRLRDREKLLEKPLRITSPELLGSELLQSALLFGLSDDVIGLDSDGISTKTERKTQKRLARSKAVVDSPSISSGSSVEENQDGAVVFGGGKLIHLEAGEPIRVKKWSKPQVVDFFAQTLAYDLLEDMKQ
uniref:Uncharacterized protein LOC100176943 n=1 Tax=Phallusia mammillata TaxID=59560 RepID=A0A6F9DFV3_9ASCI|nr:uncharacterized protein LOC100176943 [Phallusia mammillata]